MRNVGGVGEVIPDSLRNWVLPYEADAGAFAEKIRAALDLSDDALLYARGEARNACRQNFDGDRMIEELEQCLAQIRGRGG